VNEEASWKPPLPPRKFVIHDQDSLGALRGTVTATTYLQAAEYAAREYYAASEMPQRWNGWGGANGVWYMHCAGKKEPAFFYVGEVGREISAPPLMPSAPRGAKPPTKPLKQKAKPAKKAKAKR
jgi:hypothetical protein